MKLIHLYLIGVFVMIAFLVGSTMWQFGQFQSNIKDLQFGLPQELSQGMPDANQQIAQMMSQIQTQAQNSGAATPAGENASTTVETKTWTAPDESFSFEYAADWTPMAITAPVDSAGGKILFSAYKTGGAAAIPSVNSLSVEESDYKTAEELMEKIESDLRAKNIPAKITRSEIINGAQTIPVIEIDYSISEAILNANVNFKIINAFIIKEDPKIYVVSIVLQNSNPTILQETDGILKSLRVKSE
ncbi:MAG: hypothetical protein YFSK_1550 [Candidatus Yanofskyibacterium parasiticum]|nr:MAG: hypothetical protein YFSK_1550 [Candidatus Yanofskybacteria bacterium]